MKRLTVFTATYNRAYILPKLYDSLCEQTCQDFEWLIVDDGSTDNTRELVDGWIHEKVISARYFYQENAGKMMAHNKAVNEAYGELFMCVDSDDHLNSESVVKDTLAFWDEQNEKLGDSSSDLCGLIAFKQIGQKIMSFPEGMMKAHLSELLAKGFRGETSTVYKRVILERYPFPYFPGEKFVPDFYLCDQIDRDYKLLLFPYYMQNCRYQVGGYSSDFVRLLYNNPCGYRAYRNQCIRFKKKGYLKDVICYVALSLRIRDGKMLSMAANLPMTLLLFPFGVLKYFYDNYRLSRTEG